MAKNNTATGSVLTIPEDLLTKLSDVDEKIAKLQKTAEKTEEGLKTSFLKMAADVSPLENALEKARVKLVGLLEATKQINVANITNPKDEIAKEKLLQAQSQTRKKQLVDEEKILQAQADTRNKIIEEQKKQIELQTKIFNLEQKQAKAKEAAAKADYKKDAKKYKTDNYKKNTTYQGSLEFAKNAHTVDRYTRSIQYLTAARNNLSSTDAQYGKKLRELNAAITEMNRKKQQAIAGAGQLRNAHRGLMDTVGQLQRQFALMFSVSQVWGYVKTMAEVRGEFELQQRSLQAIIQNKAKADEVFNKTVALAVQSPFRIKELVSYTKQLAAYRIQTDELYETTKRLADVSAGLGVDMQRLILAYGQVKAAAYLRGTEVRQFTEAGINVYGELQSYFKEVKGEAYTTAQIVDMISKRKVTFEDIEQVFKRLTDKGGLFYNMQAIQAETLQGKISNLKDSLDVFLNEMGKNTEGVLKGAINATTWMLRNFEGILVIAKALLPILVAIKVQSMITAASMSAVMSGTVITRGFGLWSAMLPTLRAMGIAIKNIGTTIRGLFATGAGWFGVAVAALGAFVEYLQRVSKYEEAVNEANKAFAESKVRLDELRNSATDSKIALEKLIKMMKDANFEVDIDVKRLSDEDAKKKFKELSAEFERLNNMKLKFDVEIAKNEKNTYFTDDIREDAEEYKESVNNMLAETVKLEEGVTFLKSRYDQLTPSVKALVDQMTPKRDNETSIQYFQRLASVFEKLKNATQSKAGGKGLGSDEYFIAVNTSKYYSIANNKIKEYTAAQTEAISQAGKLRRVLKSNYEAMIQSGMSKEQAAKIIHTFINSVAQSEGWSEIKDMLYKNTAWDIKVNVDEKDAKEKILSVKDQLQMELDRDKIKITAEVMLSPHTPLDSYLDMQEAQQKRLDQLYKGLDMLNKDKRDYYLAGELAKGGFDYSKIKITSGKNAGQLATENSFIDEKFVKQWYEEQIKALESLGFKRTEKGRKGKQTDIYEERIKLLKDMQSEYEKLTQIMSKEEALQKVMLLYNDEMARTGLSGITSLDKQSVADKVKELAKLVKDFSKKGSANRDANSLQLEIDTDAATKDIEKIKSTVEEKLKQWDIVESLKTEGFDNDIITALFPDAPTSANAITEYITSAFTGKNGEKYIKAREELEKKVGEKVLQQNEETMKEIIKTYGKAQSEYLKVENWYADEKSKILTTIPQSMQQGLLESLDKLYSQKKTEALWKDESGSESFIKLFENLEYASNKSIDSMVAGLENMKGALKGQDSEVLEQILNKLQELRKVQLERNPIKTLAKSFKDLKKATNGDERQKALMGISESLGGMKNKVDEINSAFGSFSSMMEGFGVKIAPEVEQAMSGVSQALGGATQFAEAYAKKDPVGMIAGGLETISGIGNTLSAFFGGNDDAKLQREIERHQKNIERLQRAYDQLKESMDNAWNINRLVGYQNEAIKTIEAQNASLQAMIKAEEDKKETDHDAIEEWQNQIEDNLKLIKEIEGELVEQLGGFGSEQNFKSAAEAFSSAWIDAFNNTEDTLTALKKTMDDYFDNMLKKQLMQRASDKYLRPVLEKFDAMFAEGSEGGAGGTEVTSSEIEAVKKLKEEQLKGFDEYAHQLMEILGIKPSGSSELSKLQQGIQSITETTGQALESLLNSMRFFVSQQATDVSAIRAILTERLGTITGQSQESPVVSAIENQTAVIREIRSMFSDVFRYGHPKGGAGIKIFMD